MFHGTMEKDSHATDQKKLLQQDSSNGLNIVKLEENLRLKQIILQVINFSPYCWYLQSRVNQYDCCQPRFLKLSVHLTQFSKDIQIHLKKSLRFECQNKNCRRQSNTREENLQGKEITTQLNISMVAMTEKYLKIVKSEQRDVLTILVFSKLSIHPISGY